MNWTNPTIRGTIKRIIYIILGLGSLSLAVGALLDDYPRGMIAVGGIIFSIMMWNFMVHGLK